MPDPHASSALTALIADAASFFQSTFRRAPTVAAVSPGRVNLIGDHVDYCGGLVLPMAIDRHTVVCAGAGEAGLLRAASLTHRGVGVAHLLDAAHEMAPGWLRYPAGVVAKLRERGIEVGGVDFAFASDLPPGAGLSSSAAIEVATCIAVEKLAGRGLDRLSRARLAQDAEHAYAGVPCGIMDQYTVAFAAAHAALLIDCESLTHRDIAIPAGAEILIIDSGMRHDLAADAYAECRRECARALTKIAHIVGPRPSLRRVSRGDLEAALAAGAPLSATETRRARHVISEIARTLDAAAALLSGDLVLMGRLMLASHASLRDDFEVSRPEVDSLVARVAGMPGVFGARMTGGGFGGCVVALVDSRTAASVLQGLRDELPTGRLCLASRPAAGASAVSLAVCSRAGPPAIPSDSHDHPPRADGLPR